MQHRFYIYALFLFLALGSCLKPLEDISFVEPDESGLGNILFPASFNFSTTKNVDIELTAPEFLSGFVFEIFYTNPLGEMAFILKGTFDQSGKYRTKTTLPAITDTIHVYSKSLGLEKHVILPINQNKVVYDYRIHFDEPRDNSFIYGTPLKSAQVDQFGYMGSYNANGSPSYLFKVNDRAWQPSIKNLNQTLPEGVSVMEYRPQFLEGNKQNNLVLKERSKVFVTFGAEGTNLTSSLGYYISNGTKPVNQQHIIIFPNASHPGSGGSSHGGDQVFLGEFPANTEIGWFLVPNGWNKQTKKVTDVQGVFYSDSEFNPGGITQMLLLKDIQNEVIILAFEDVMRSSPLSDHDFNDAVFYISLDRLDAADLTNTNNTFSEVDTDGDGIIDSLDDYPLDPSKAFNNGGGNGSSGSLAFEDLWPAKGDYDFNDLVVDYEFSTVTDASNMVKELAIKANVRNVGGSFRNGFAIELPVPASSVERVSGTKYTRNYLKIASNGVESGTENAIVFLFDNGWDVVKQNLTVSVTFKQAISPSQLGGYPYNPFIVVNENRGREIHLPDYPPTSKADPSYFGQSADYTRPAMGLYYRSKLNLPWAIMVTTSYAIPLEKTPITAGYLHFINWAKSAGTDYPDWYLDLPGYRNKSFLN